MKAAPTHFSLPIRLLHWLMAAMILAMLFIGVGMVASVSQRHVWLVGIHKPLGMAVLLLALVRLVLRWRHGAPPLPATLPRWQRQAAHASHGLLYLLMVLMPLVGWAMLSAAGDPVTLGILRLPSILPADPLWFALLRSAHTVLAYLLFLIVLGHLGAALVHGLIRRDGVLSTMLRGAQEDPAPDEPASG